MTKRRTMAHLVIPAMLLLVACLWSGSVGGAPISTPPIRATLAAHEVEAELLGWLWLRSSRRWSAPSGVAVDRQGTLYVFDSMWQVIRRFAVDGSAIGTWGEPGTGPGQFQVKGDFGAAWGDLAIGPDGNLYVVDTFNSRIQVLGPDGSFLRAWGEPGSADGQFDVPSGMAIDVQGRVYVAEVGNRRVQCFTIDGQFLGAWTPPATEDGLPPDLGDVAVDASGQVFVSDIANGRIYRIAAAGADDAVFGENQAALGPLMSPWGLTVDAAGNLYVAEFTGNRVSVFAPDGTPLSSTSLSADQFNQPIFLTISEAGWLYVVDAGDPRIQVFSLRFS